MKLRVLEIEKIIDGENKIIFPVLIQNENRNYLVARSSHLKVEFETFILNTLCHNIDGFCTYFHNIFFNPKNHLKQVDNLRFLHSYDTSLKGSGCEIDFKKELFDARTNKIIFKRRSSKNSKGPAKKFSDACGACLVPVLDRIGIKYLKIAERGRSSQEKIRSVSFLKQSMELFRSIDDLKSYASEVRDLYRNIFNEDCKNIACYYA
jgi:collagenase-like PrtC family protease